MDSLLALPLLKLWLILASEEVGKGRDSFYEGYFQYIVDTDTPTGGT